MAKKESRYVEEFEDIYGIVMPYHSEFPFESKAEFDYSVYNEDPESTPLPEDEKIDEKIVDLHHTVLKHLQQIRSSFGFDVDCRLPTWFDWPTFIPVDLSSHTSPDAGSAIEAADYAIREINNERPEKRYKIVEVEKAVLTSNFLILVTIKVDESAGEVAVSKTIQAIVDEDFDGGFDLHQWRFKPDPVAQGA